MAILHLILHTISVQPRLLSEQDAAMRLPVVSSARRAKWSMPAKSTGGESVRETRTARPTDRQTDGRTDKREVRTLTLTPSDVEMKISNEQKYSK